MTTPQSDSIAPYDPTAFREVRYEYSPNLPQILQQLGVSLLVSTYQAGKVLVIGAHAGQLKISFLHFDRAMGVAADRERIAIGTRRQIHFLQAAPEVGRRVEPVGTHDGCWAMRSSFYTGNILGHDLAWGREGLWIANTLFSCLCTLHDGFNFIPRWRPKFVTELIDQDRCHLNGLALEQGVPRFVTVLAESDEPAGWRPTKATGGCVIDVPSGETILHGLAMPHSPRIYDQRLWVLDSGNGSLGVVDPNAGKFQPVEQMPGYTRGLSFAGPFAFVGLSKIRETNVFGGLPIAQRRDELRCGVAVVDLVSGRAISAFQFHSGVEEIFAVEVLAGSVNPAVFGLTVDEDDEHPEIWIVPPPDGSTRLNELRPAVYERPSSSPSPVGREIPPNSRRLAATGVALHRQGRLTEAGNMLERAVSLTGATAATWTDLGNLRQDQGAQESALDCYRCAVQLDPNCIPARQNLAYLLVNQGQPEEAVEHYEQLLRLAPTPLNRLLDALALPVIYDSAAEISRWRERLRSRLQAMVDEGLTVDTTNTLIPTTFFLAYQGLNDRVVMELVGQILRAPGLSAGREYRIADGDDGRIRVGFVSAYFHDHTIGRLNLGRIQRLDRQQFDVTVFYAGQQLDEMANEFHQSADRWTKLPREVAAARRLITEAQLDVLVFADVGMDALSTTLAYSRMAPVQCVTWGHPDTTGSPAVDYFLSSELLEVDGADQHYTEELIRFPLLGIDYERPVRTGPQRSRAFFGLEKERHAYLCPQTLFKFHPDFDLILASILAADPLGDIVVIEGRVAAWTDRLRRRWQRTLPDAARRVRWLPALPRDDFLALLACADVVLDPLHFGGGNTSYEALAMGVPVVTLPGEFLRSRITSALYRKLGVETCVVDCAESYAKLAVQLVCDTEFRGSVRTRLADRVGRLFDDPQEVKGLEEYLWTVASRGSRQRSLEAVL